LELHFGDCSLELLELLDLELELEEDEELEVWARAGGGRRGGVQIS